MMRDVFPHTRELVRGFFKSPVLLYRLGLGWIVDAVRIMILTTRGRKSGLPRYTPLEYRRHGSKIYVISGWGETSNWYQNLMVHPAASVKLGAKSYSVCATPVTDTAEALRTLYMFRQTAPFIYDRALARLSTESGLTARKLPELTDEFTIIRLDIMDEPLPLPTLPSDKAWVWIALAGGAVVLSALWEFLTRSRQARHE